MQPTEAAPPRRRRRLSLELFLCHTIRVSAAFFGEYLRWVESIRCRIPFTVRFWDSLHRRPRTCREVGS